jgi:isopentenyldiphosphate isomerase
MEQEQLQHYVELAYGGEVPDFDWAHWRRLYEDFDYTYFLFTPKELIDLVRIQIMTEWEIDYTMNFVDRHAPKDADGNITDDDWTDTFKLAMEEMRRMGLARIPRDPGLKKRKYDDWRNNIVADNSAYYK